MSSTKINNTTLKWLAVILAIIAVNQALTKYTFSIGNIYYGIVVAIAFISFFQTTIKKVNVFMAFVYVAAILSIVTNNISAIYQPWPRFLLFVLVTILISPFIQSDFLDRLRVLLMKYCNKLLVVVIILSIPMIVTRTTGITGFEGITSHSMLIAPISAISLLTIIYWLYNKSGNRILLIAIAVLTFISLVFAASRVSLGGFIVGALYFFYRVNKNNLIQFAKVFIITFIILGASYPLWNSYLDNIEKKNASVNRETGEQDLTSSRTLIWGQRIREFNSSPVTGVGFAYAPYVIGFNKRSETPIFEENSKGVVEPGSSWLAIISMTGIIGGVSMLMLWIQTFKLTIKSELKDQYFSIYLGSLLAFWSTHMIAEGQIFAAGGPMFFWLWLTIGAIHGTYNVLYNSKSSI